MNDKARIALAEATGWVRDPHPLRDTPFWFDRITKKQGELGDLPDPFTDANDDYAVLEWMRGRRDSLLAKDTGIWREFMAVIHDTAFCTSLYRIGDYARAACKVLGIELEGET